MNKTIILLFGQISSGKGTVADYIQEKYNAGYIKYSSVFRDILNRLNLEISRKNMQDLSTLLRDLFGEDLLSKVVSNDVKKMNKEIIVIDGARRMSDIEDLKKFPNTYLVYIDASEKVRYERIINRNENTDDNKKTFEQFQEDAKSESESQILETRNNADFVIDNNGSLDDLKKQIDKLLINTSESSHKKNR